MVRFMKNISFLKNIVIAHRGIYDNKTIPENSMRAFKKALYKKIPIELDVHLTKDHQVVVFHDDNLKRMTGINRNIKDCSYQELQDFFLLETSEKIPLLSDVLTLINGKVLIDIEIKNDGRMGKMNYLLTELLDSYSGKFMVKSFYPQYMVWFKKYRPDYIRGLLITKKMKFYNLIIHSKFCLKYLNIDFVACRKDLVSSSNIQKIRKAGIVIFAWTIHSLQELREISSFVDSYISEIF